MAPRDNFPINKRLQPRPQSAQPIKEPQIPQPTPEIPRSQAASGHPEKFLNRLSPSDQQKFLDQFSVLNIKQQTYAYNQFLSTPPEIQKHAISQFLSLDSQVLIVSIQVEIEKGEVFVENLAEIEDERKSQESLPVQANRRRIIQNPKGRRAEDSRNPNRPRQADLQALQLQKHQQKLQQQQLQDIIRQQHNINLQAQGQTIIM